MQAHAAPFDGDSTLVRRGIKAINLTDLADFVETMQTRPLDKLLAELPGLAALSETKFSLARQVIRRRARSLQRVEFEQLRVMAFEGGPDRGHAGDPGPHPRPVHLRLKPVPA